MPLENVKADVRRALGCTINDLVLATVTGAVREFLLGARGTMLDGVDFRIAAPVSIRSADDTGQDGQSRLSVVRSGAGR